MPDDPLDVGMLEKWKSRVLDYTYRLLHSYAGIILYVAFTRQTTLCSRKELDSKSMEKVYHKSSECTWKPEEETKANYPELFLEFDFGDEVPF